MSQSFALPVISTEIGLAKYIEEVNKFPYLTQEEESKFAIQWSKEKDLEAAHMLVTSHLRMVVKIAMGYRGYGLPLMDLIAEGNIGLMHAVKKFDPKKGFRLATYAMWWIKASIQEYILKTWSLVKIGTTSAQKKLFFNLKKMKTKIHKVDENALSLAEVKSIAGELDVSEHEVVEMDKRLAHNDQSLNAPIGIDKDESYQLIDFVADESETQENMLAEMSDYNHKKSLLTAAMNSLNDREKDIITKRQLKEPAATLEDISIEYGISRERVRQIEARSMEKIKQYVEENAAA